MLEFSFPITARFFQHREGTANRLCHAVCGLCTLGAALRIYCAFIQDLVDMSEADVRET